MNKFILALTAGTAILAVSPASAQYSDRMYNGTGDVSGRISQLESRLQAGISAGTIDRSEARSLYRQIRDLNRLERQYNIDGLSQDERRDLQQRIRYTREELRTADGGRNAELTGDDYYDRYTRQSPSSRYREISQVCDARSGASGFFGSLFGGDSCLIVGERPPSGLSALPSQYRDEFPDSPSYYHRYRNGNVVQIDSRTGDISRIFDVFQSASR